MFTFYYCIQEGDFFNLKIDLLKKNEIIDKYELKHKGIVKEYWENNVKILISKQKNEFNYIHDLTIEYDQHNKYLIQEYDSKPCPTYNFYKVDQEEIYQLYEAREDNIIVQLKEYDNFLTISYLCKEKSNFTNKFFF